MHKKTAFTFMQCPSQLSDDCKSIMITFKLETSATNYSAMWSNVIGHLEQHVHILMILIVTKLESWSDWRVTTVIKTAQQCCLLASFACSALFTIANASSATNVQGCRKALKLYFWPVPKKKVFLKIAKATEMRFSREMLHLSLV